MADYSKAISESFRESLVYLDTVSDEVFEAMLLGDIVVEGKVVKIGAARRARISKSYEKAKSSPPGSGERFKALVHGGMSPALAAWIGRKKYGAEGMKKMSLSGKRKSAGSRAA